MKRQVLCTFITLTLLILGSCSDNEVEETPGLNISKIQLIFKAAGEKLSFNIESNTDWEITINNGSWLNVNPLAGNGNMEIFVEASENMGEEIQSAQLTIKTSSLIRVVDIKQEATLVNPAEQEGLHYPLLTINTENGKAIDTKDYYINATITLESRDEKGTILEKLLEVETEIRGRGNSTWGMEKKPYRLKLAESSEILGMPKNKHWVLLANYADKTLMRNELAFEVSRRMGFEYTPRMKYVDVVLNDNYIGSYMLGEHIRIDKNRVNIHELNPADTNITGGYLLEIDERKGEPEWFETQKAKMIFCINRPEEIPANQKKYISNHIQTLENIFYGVDGANPVTDLAQYLDMKSFIDYYLLNELSKNVDGNLRLSTFVYKKQNDDKVYFGPAWDYDIAFGNVNYDECDKYTGWHARRAEWYQQFFSYPEFERMVKDRWTELRTGELADIHPFITSLAEQMNISQRKNFERWPILNVAVWPNPAVSGSYEGEVQYLKSWLTSRLDWIDEQLK
jgi:CotH protein.